MPKTNDAPDRPRGRRTRSGALALLVLASVGLPACEQDVAPVIIARCFEDADCMPGEVCVDGQCIPRDALSCTAVEGGAAILQPGPPLLDMGYVGSGTAQRALILRNIGDCTLTVFDAYFEKEGESPFVCPFCAPERFPIELFPFRDHELRVLFTPDGVGDFEDELVLLSDDAEFPEIRVPIRARFDGVPELAVAPTAVDFDYAPVGRTVTKTIKLTNQGTGNAPLSINELRIESATAATFSVMPELAEPVELRPVRAGQNAMEALDLTLRYKPAEIAAHTGELVIVTNERGNSVVRVPLQGSSRTPAKIAVSPDAIRFGPVPIGQSTSVPLTIVNEGGTPLRVTPRWGGTGLSTDLSAMPQVVPAVAPGQFTELQVFVTATSPGPITGLLILESNDPTRPSLTVPVSAEGQEVVGAQVVKIEMSFENGSDSFFDDDFRNVDMALENPFGLICDERTPNPTNWMAFGTPSWLAFGPKEEPERIVLPDAMQDGTYRVVLTYQEDCSSVPAGIVASVLGISVETLINALTGGVGTGPSSDDISGVIDNLCFNRSGTTATVTVYVNGQVIAEVPARLGSKGELVYALDLERRNGTFSVIP